MSDDKEQSALGYMFSKEGRPMLIGLGVIVVVFGAIFYYTFTMMSGGTRAEVPPPTDAQRAAAGESNVSAVNRRPGGDLTSQGLSPEARSALDEFNRQASAEGRMGQPTPDDVVIINVDENGLPIEPESEEEQAEAQQNAAPALPAGNSGDRRRNGQASGPQMEKPAEGVRRTVGNNGIDTDMSALTREQQERRINMTPERLELAIAEHEEYRNRRMQAAVELVNFESQPSAISSLSFAANSSGSDAPKPARIERRSNGSGATNTFVGSDEGGSSGGTCEAPLVKGGEIRYAVSDIALNTDFQGPVRVSFLDGDLRGYIGMGSFELNELGARMKLRIEQIFDPDGVGYSVSGYGLDPETTLWAQASNVDRHIIYRYGGFGLGSVLSAFQILAENRATISEVNTENGATVTQNRDPDGKQVTWTVLGEFGELFEEIARDAINRPITVTLDPNEEMAVLFEDTVCRIDNETNEQRRTLERRRSMGFGDPLQSNRYNNF